jgi:hypothetical protein
MEYERRRADPDIALIKKDVEYIKQFIEEDREKMREHLQTSDSFREKVTKLSGLQNEFNDHRVQDRWIQGLMATSQLAIVGMLIRLVLTK